MIGERFAERIALLVLSFVRSAGPASSAMITTAPSRDYAANVNASTDLAGFVELHADARRCPDGRLAGWAAGGAHRFPTYTTHGVSAAMFDSPTAADCVGSPGTLSRCDTVTPPPLLHAVTRKADATKHHVTPRNARIRQLRSPSGHGFCVHVTGARAPAIGAWTGP